MSKKGTVPDAWDEDWESMADKTEPKAASPAPKLTKSERRAQHMEQQKQLWDSAENPDRFHWLETQGVVPLKQDFKPQVKLLSRKPVAPAIAKRGATNGVAGLTLDDGDDSEEERRKKIEADSEERARQAKVEREEKLRKYAEARERIMGTPSQAQPAVTRESREGPHGRENRKTRGKPNGNRSSQPTSSADQSPARPDKQLFDPDDIGRRTPKRESTPREDLPSRQPRGPESGRGGFGFLPRGGKAST